MRISQTIKREQVDEWLRLLSENKVDKVIKDLQLIRHGLRPYRKRLNSSKANKGVPTKVVNTAEKFKNKLTYKQTTYELIMKALLKSARIAYEFQHVVHYTDPEDGIKKFYIVDFYLPNSGIIIEVDGGYHDELYQQKLDRKRTANLKDKGYRYLLRIKNTDLEFKTSDTIITEIKTFIKDAKKQTKKVKDGQ